MENNFSADNISGLAGACDNTETTQDTQTTTTTESNTQSTQGKTGFDSKEVQKTFSERLNKEREKIRAELSEQYTQQNTLFEKLKELTGKDELSADDMNAYLLEKSDTLKEEQLEASEEESSVGLAKLIDAHPQIIEARQAKEKAENIIRENIFRRDLEDVKQAFPDIKAQSVFELGDRFIELMQTGKVDPVTAYAACMQLQNMSRKDKPASMGNVKSGGAAERDYYSPDEVDRLPKSAYNNPKVMDRIRRSMPKWNKS